MKVTGLTLNRLNQNKFLLFSILLLSGCTTSSFKQELGNYNEWGWQRFRTTIDRVVLSCEKLDTDAAEDAYGFDLYALDENNQVIVFNQFNFLDEESCFERLKIFEKMKKMSNFVIIGAYGSRNKPKEFSKFSTYFPGHGTFQDNDQVMPFRYIANDYGLCYHAYNGENCPKDEFPGINPAHSNK